MIFGLKKMETLIETAVRICPFGAHQIGSPTTSSCESVYVEANPLTNTVHLGGQYAYPVSRAVPFNASQHQVYTATAQPLLGNFLDGCDVSVVVLGAIHTGKSYTLLGGGFHLCASEAEYGLIGRFVRDVFTRVAALQQRGIRCTVGVACSQITAPNRIVDCLSGGGGLCATTLECFHWLQNADIKPAAHTVFTLTLEQSWSDNTSNQYNSVSTASFVELTAAAANDIGFYTLQRCIALLANDGLGVLGPPPPYADSVLTTVLKDSFGGRAKTLLLCCASSHLQDLPETLFYLQLTLAAQRIRNNVTVNSYVTQVVPKLDDDNNVFQLQFAANQLFKLVTNAEQLFQRLVADCNSDQLSPADREQIVRWLTLKHECEECFSADDDTSEALQLMKRSLERIDEEDANNATSCTSSDDEEDEEEPVVQTEALMDRFRCATDDFIFGRHVEIIEDSEEDSYQTTPSRRTMAAQSVQQKQRPLQSKQKILKQIECALSGCERQCSDLEKTIRVKETLLEQLKRHSSVKQAAEVRLQHCCNQLKHDIEQQADEALILQLEQRLNDTESLKLMSSSQKITQLEVSLLASRRNLEKLKQYEMKETTRQKALLTEIIVDKDSNKSVIPTTVVKEQEQKQPELIGIVVVGTASSADLDELRTEISTLRTTRERLLEERQQIIKCTATSAASVEAELNEVNERKLLQLEEAVEAIDATIEYKNGVLCGRSLQQMTSCSSDNISGGVDGGVHQLAERVLHLNVHEIRLLLYRYFERVVELRSTARHLEIQMLETETQNEDLACRVQNLSCQLQQVRLEAERRVCAVEQQHEHSWHLVMRHLAGANLSSPATNMLMGKEDKHGIVERQKSSALATPQISTRDGACKRLVNNAGGGGSGGNSSLIARFTRIASTTTTRRLEGATVAAAATVKAGMGETRQTQVTRQKNKIFIQKTSK